MSSQVSFYVRLFSVHLIFIIQSFEKEITLAFANGLMGHTENQHAMTIEFVSSQFVPALC